MKRSRSVGIYGFSGNDAEVVERVLSETGAACRIMGDIRTTLDSADCPSVLFGAVPSEAAFDPWRKATADRPDLVYCLALPSGERSLLFKAENLGAPFLCFLPPDPAEIKKTARRAFALVEEDDKEKDLRSGLKQLSVDFAWKTRDLSVSGACRAAARIMRAAGFVAGLAEEDEAALALEEALTNSIEHGNLELDSSLRSDDFSVEDKYEALRVERLATDAYGGRPIGIAIRADADSFSLDITDGGKGFDVSAARKAEEGFKAPDLETIADVSGKGTALIKRAFDTVTYNDKGTMITLSRKKRC